MAFVNGTEEWLGPAPFGRVIGVDFDNTIVSYDALLFHLAREQALIGEATPARKRAVRDAVRRLENGEELWQRLQAHVYGPGMESARLFPGVRDFFRACRKANVPVYIVSHKTERASMDPRGPNLRECALAWMRQRQFFDPAGFGLEEGHVFFAASRAEKLARIAQLGITHFIDDLEETFREAAFPPGVERILFAPEDVASSPGPWQTFPAWSGIQEHLLGGCHAA